MGARAGIASVEVFDVRFPFRQPFVHHLAARRGSRSLVVRVRLEDGTTGHGEALPRPYLTGETEQGVVDALSGPLAALAAGWDARDLPSAARALRSPAARVACARAPAAFCGLELALLDAAGRRSGRPVTDLLGPVLRRELPYESAVVGLLPRALYGLHLERIRQLGKRVVKLKAGSPRDLENVALARKVLGDGVQLILDANAAWPVAEAIERIGSLEAFELAAVEQPVAREDVAGLAAVRRAVRTPIMADESIATRADAERLLAADACDLWNLRVGKCGGLLQTLELAALAARHGIGTQLGVLVGETGILGSAGRLLAACHDGFLHLEFDSTGMRQGDVLRTPLAPVVDGRAPLSCDGAGLGFEVDAARLETMASARWTAFSAGPHSGGRPGVSAPWTAVSSARGSERDRER
ncbi:MAG: enolase C-terminal domain-like protein [Vicinamibacteria bacterium]